ncbi:MAG: hypothetical protein A2381_06010 [Bdellovibrionales bacterium RIFOXYB1_FULL_37_110]|nr:MAG: hypothetical protein A2417_04895 [Bdellovibrionales bacterium RIFOXYC1_FULL_37_79]OFZ59375.1 MAG: hypothetical protein A2381_06010 [Bdellovibrionales bacterium RIFOXYB1_FULL_37_110]OFZ61935.1 MAG: hypothetical protein A2577_17895 [Bdellovibrionales bacterium RIFOXYD1_FULL_36_51]
MLSREINILVVDDVKAMRKYIIRKLKVLGFQNFDEAENGEEAWGKINTGKIHLVLSDVNMPIMNGIDCLKTVRNSASHRDIPFILITAEMEEKTKRQAEEAKATAYLVKPFNDEDLAYELEKIGAGATHITEGMLVNKHKEKHEMKKVGDEAFLDTILEGVEDVLSDQCGVTLKVGMTQRVAPGKAWGVQSDAQISSVSYLISDQKEFSIIIYFDEKVYLAYASRMFGKQFEHINEAGDDLAGEWLSIALGSIKKVCNDDLGWSFSNMIPTTIKGKQLIIGSQEKSIVVCPFESSIGTFHLILSMGAEKVAPWDNAVNAG